MVSAITLLSLVSAAVAHGTVSNIVINGVFYEGYNPSYQYINPAPITVGWTVPLDLDNGFVPTTSYSNSDIICHKSAGQAKIAAPVAAGSKVELQWTPWPVSHKGPVIDYIANCNGPCETVDKTTLLWVKIDQVGLLNPNISTGYWGTDILIANNSTWIVEIPPTLAKGNYVLRHEIIALHAAGSPGGAQAYPQCVNLAVSGSGTARPVGVSATTFYKSTDPGILYNLYNTPLSPYIIPGPPLWTSAVILPTSTKVPPPPTATSSGVYTVT